MSTKRKKVPRASLAVTLLSDPDFILLMQHPEGREAFGLFAALLLVAKDQGNQGVFAEPVDTIALMMRVPPPDLERAIDEIKRVCDRNNNEPWVIRYRGKTIIRSFAHWNELRGGAREGAGRPLQEESKKIQKESNGNRLNVFDSPPVTDSVSVPVSAPSSCAKPHDGHDHGDGENGSARSGKKKKGKKTGGEVPFHLQPEHLCDDDHMAAWHKTHAVPKGWACKGREGLRLVLTQAQHAKNYARMQYQEGKTCDAVKIFVASMRDGCNGYLFLVDEDQGKQRLVAMEEDPATTKRRAAELRERQRVEYER